MNFYDSRDWLNREPPYAFQWDHILLVFIGLAIGVLLAMFLRNKSQKNYEKDIRDRTSFIKRNDR